MMRGNIKHPGERVLYETRPQLVINMKSMFIKLVILILLLHFFGPIVSAVATLQNYLVSFVQVPLVEAVTVLLLLIILILLLWIIWDILSWKAIHYILTDRRVMIKRGLIRKERVYMHYNKIQDISASQSLAERILRSGDIEIFGGHERTTLILENIPDPGKVEDMINRLIEGDEVVFKNRRSPERLQKGSIKEEYEKKFRR